MRLCVVILFILNVRLGDAPAGVTQEESHAGFLNLPSAVLAFIFIARRIQLSLSLADHEAEFCVPARINRSPFVRHLFFIFIFIYFLLIYFFVKNNASSCDCTEIRTHVLTSEGFEVTN